MLNIKTHKIATQPLANYQVVIVQALTFQAICLSI